MTDGQTEPVEIQPQNVDTLPKQPCEGTCGNSPTRELAITARGMDDDLQDLIFAANQLDSGRNNSDTFQQQMRTGIENKIYRMRKQLNRIEKLLFSTVKDGENHNG